MHEGSVDANYIMEQVELVNSIDVGRSAEVQIFFQGCLDHVVSSTAHNLLQPSVNNILFLGALQQELSIELLFRNVGCLLNHVQQICFGFLLPFSLHSSRTNVVKVLQPFEVTYSHTTSIAEDVRQEMDASVD